MKPRLQSLKAKADAARQSPAYHAEGASIRFTEELIARMKDCGLTRSALAEKIGTSPAYITKILRGDTNFTLDSMARIAHAMDCELNFELQPMDRPVTPARRAKVSYRDASTLPSPVLNDKPRG
jgi:transcriptional regulator with XRE-family HTH domain